MNTLKVSDDVLSSYIDTEESSIRPELQNEGIERARYLCMGPPIMLELLDKSGCLLEDRSIDSESYWEGHKSEYVEHAMYWPGLSLFGGFIVLLIGIVSVLRWLSV